mgnify:CR=1 FL=1
MKNPQSLHLSIFLLSSLAVFIGTSANATEPKSLVDLAQPDSLKLETQGGAKYELVTHEGKPAIKVSIPAKKGYPGVMIQAAIGNWDLS